jgi:hypothetical protein
LTKPDVIGVWPNMPMFIRSELQPSSMGQQGSKADGHVQPGSLRAGTRDPVAGIHCHSFNHSFNVSNPDLNLSYKQNLRFQRKEQ